MELQKIYVKDGHEIGVTSTFIYSSTIYKIWKNGASLVEEKSYSCNRPLNLDKIKKQKLHYFRKMYSEK